MAQSINIDINQIKQKIIAAFNQYKTLTITYWKSCTKWQQYAWYAVGAGIFFIILALILW